MEIVSELLPFMWGIHQLPAYFQQKGPFMWIFDFFVGFLPRFAMLLFYMYIL